MSYESVLFKLVLHDATCLAMALWDKLKEDCSVLNALFGTYLATFLGL